MWYLYSKATENESVPQQLNTIGSSTSPQNISPLHQLHHALGNQAVQRLFKSGVIQAKFRVSAPNDIYEQEADQLVAYPQLESRLIANKGAGNPLSEPVRGSMENVFGRDFREVRVHSDNESVRMNQALNAQAFTLGKDVYFNKGMYQPKSQEGKRLLAHELTHVVQQNSSSDSPGLERKILPAQSRESKKWKCTFKFKFNYMASPDFGFEFRAFRAEALERRIKKLLARLKKRNRDLPVVDTKRLEYSILMHLAYLDEVFGLPIATGTKRRQSYVYKIQVGFPGERVYSMKLVSPRVAIVKTPQEIAAKEAEKEMSPAERMKNAVENIDESLAKFDKWVAWAEYLSQDLETTKRVSEMRKYLNQYRKPISNALKAAEITTQAGQFVYQLENTMNYSPGTPEAAKAFAELGKPVGDLLGAISKAAPPGVKLFLEALAEASRSFPGLVEDVERAGDPLKRMRHRKDWWVLERPGRR